MSTLSKVAGIAIVAGAFAGELFRTARKLVNRWSERSAKFSIRNELNQPRANANPLCPVVAIYPLLLRSSLPCPGRVGCNGTANTCYSIMSIYFLSRRSKVKSDSSYYFQF